MSCNKKSFATKEIAEDALIEARTVYAYSKGRGPIAVYLCDECGQYHLTSQGATNEKLLKYESEGKIDLQKEANKWIGKIKDRRR